MPRTRDMARLVRQTAAIQGTPRFVITDHGTQFGKRFQAHLASQGITQVRGRIRAPFLNGKVERAFRTFRIWWRLALVALGSGHIQHRLDAYRHWYNEHRPHSAVGGLTPAEAWHGQRLPPPTPFFARDAVKISFAVQRRRCRGDPGLPIIEITRRAA